MENTNNGKMVSAMDVQLKQLKIYFTTIVLFICFGCNSDTDRIFSYQTNIAFDFSDSLNAFSIHNNHNFPVTFRIKINDLFPLNFEEIKKIISLNASKEDIPTPQSAWQFVVENTFTVLPAYTTENWQHEPLLFLNSIGGGLCDDRASVLAAIWRAQGDSSRVIGLEGHVVPEIYKNNKWQMYDPSLEIFYCDSNSLILSVGEIENSPERIFLSDCNHAKLNSLFHKKNSISNYFLSLYVSKENNKDVTDWHLDYQSYLNDFVLPSYSTLQILFDKENNLTSICVKLNISSNGKLQIPLVPYIAKGIFEFTIQNEKISTNGTNYQFPEKKFVNEIYIEKVLQASEIHYLVNPKLKYLKHQNNIDIKATEPLETKVFYSFEQSNILFGKAELFFNLKSNQNNTHFDVISSSNSEILDSELLKEQFSSFLNNDSIY